MSTQLHDLWDTHRPSKRRKRVGRGIGSGRGKTCTRGTKGAGARSGWKSRPQYEGGQLPLFKRVPGRGFSNAPFRKEYATINLGEIDAIVNDGDVVTFELLLDKRVVPFSKHGLKVLSDGEITKKISIEAVKFSKKAIEKLDAAGIGHTTL